MNSSLRIAAMIFVVSLFGCKPSEETESEAKEVWNTDGSSNLVFPEFAGQEGQVKHWLHGNREGSTLFYRRCEDPGAFTWEKCKWFSIAVTTVTTAFQADAQLVQFLTNKVLPDVDLELACYQTGSNYGTVCTGGVGKMAEYRQMVANMVTLGMYTLNNGVEVDKGIAKAARDSF